jgi:ribosomal protein L11 methyltransferase
VTVFVPLARSEEARATMIELFPEGFEERERDAVLELSAYTERPDAVARLEPLGRVSESPVAFGWEDAWRSFHKPVTIGPLWIGPPWETADGGSIPIVIDPGQAFGTGAHATTRLCIELLLDLEPAGLVDLGCGSGVLAVAAAKLGFEPVLALDDDELAVEAARENAASNAVAVEVRRADVLVDALPRVDVAIANIARAPVEQAIERFEGRLVVASGYRHTERPEPRGWRVADRRAAEGWAADLLERD